MIGFAEDFRASVHPDTAQRRLDHFRQRLDAAQAAKEQEEARGRSKQWFGADADWRYRELLKAHVAFAQAQLRDRQEPDPGVWSTVTDGTPAFDPREAAETPRRRSLFSRLIRRRPGWTDPLRKGE